MQIFIGVVIPFLGTTLGALLVFLLKNKLNEHIEKLLIGFAAGVMIAASIWSLIDPAINMSSNLGKLAFLPAAVGFMIGILFLFLLDILVPHTHVKTNEEEGLRSGFKKSTKMMFAVTLHNIPEGMAVGVVLAGTLYGNSLISMSAALSLSIGIAIQNFPEGAIISLPLYQENMSKPKSFLMGVLSGVVEPIAAIITIFLVRFISPILPYILAFAAGAMIYVVVEELIPEFQVNGHSNLATIALALGFVLMMILDIALGWNFLSF